MSEKKNKKVIILVSPPAGGKTTYALNYLAKNQNTIRVNRDSYRFMLRDTPVTENKIEDLITDLSNDAIIKALNKNLDVIIDNTNLKLRYINDIIELVKFKADIEFIVLDCSLDKLLERDKNREKSVGEHVVKKMYKQYKDLVESYAFQNIKKRPEHEDRFVPLRQDFSLPHAVIFDVDGNLAQMKGRGPFDWHKVDNDDVIEVVAEQVKIHKSIGRKIIVVSGRDSVCRDKTIEWFNFYNIEFDELFMRPENNWDKDTTIKKKIFNEQIKDKYNVVSVFDDRISVCKMWTELGLFCFCTNQGLKVF